jgi:hypothetical protein
MGPGRDARFGVEQVSRVARLQKNRFQSCKVARFQSSNAVSKGGAVAMPEIVVSEYRGHKRPIGRRAPRFPGWQSWRPWRPSQNLSLLREAAASSRQSAKQETRESFRESDFKVAKHLRISICTVGGTPIVLPVPLSGSSATCQGGQDCQTFVIYDTGTLGMCNLEICNW